MYRNSIHAVSVSIQRKCRSWTQPFKLGLKESLRRLQLQDAKIGMLGNIGEIAIRGQQEKAMFDAGCSDQAIDRTGLDAVDSTPLPQLCRSDRGASMKRNERKRFQDVLEAIEVLFVSQSIEEFLENIASQKHSVFRADVCAKGQHKWGHLPDPWPSKHERPDRCINDNIQRLVRCSL